MAEQRRILITGAAGMIGSDLSDGLEPWYTLRLHTRNVVAEQTGPQERVAADIADYDQTRGIMEGVDTVVHLAGDPSVGASWESLLSANIVGLRNVLEAARDAGVRRVVFASTNHTMGMYDRDGAWPVYVTMPVRPDSLYGASKAMGEVLGRFYHDAHGLDFISLRIGWYGDDPWMADDQPVGRGMWLSPRDTVNVVRGAIETDKRFGIYYAVSDNPDRRWDITNTMIDLGYRPQDAWDRVREMDEGHEPGDPPQRQEWPTT